MLDPQDTDELIIYYLGQSNEKFNLLGGDDYEKGIAYMNREKGLNSAFVFNLFLEISEKSKLYLKQFESIKPKIEEKKNEENNQKKIDEAIAYAVNKALTSGFERIKEEITQTAIKSAVQLCEKNAKKSTAIHSGVSCNGCKMYPIVGNRYKCTQCYDFDLCDECEAKAVDHMHPMIKFKAQRYSEENHDENNKLKSMRETYDLKNISDQRIIEALRKSNGNTEEAVCILFLLSSKI